MKSLNAALTPSMAAAISLCLSLITMFDGCSTPNYVIDDRQRDNPTLDNRQRVLVRHPEARIYWGDSGYGWEGWIVAVQPMLYCKGSPPPHDWKEIGADNLSEDTAWFTALEWLLAYDYWN